MMLAISAVVPADAELKLDMSPATRLVEVDVHAQGGFSTITQNYRKSFPQIQNLNVNAGAAVGFGARAVFGLRQYLGFGTAIDFTVNNYNIDITVLGSDKSSMSAIFLDNRYYRVTIPVFMSLRIQVDRIVRWNIDAGLFYSYGLAGHQKQLIYRADINEMEELVPQIINVKTDYYHSDDTFISRFNRGDIGIHLSTSLNFGKHLIVGAKMQYGLKNASQKTGVTVPRVNNIDFAGTVGYRF